MHYPTELIEHAQAPIVLIVLQSKRSWSAIVQISQNRPKTALFVAILVLPMSALVILGGGLLLVSLLFTLAVGTAIFAPALVAIALGAVATWGTAIAAWSVFNFARNSASYFGSAGSKADEIDQSVPQTPQPSVLSSPPLLPQTAETPIASVNETPTKNAVSPCPLPSLDPIPE